MSIYTGTGLCPFTVDMHGLFDAYAFIYTMYQYSISTHLTVSEQSNKSYIFRNVNFRQPLKGKQITQEHWFKCVGVCNKQIFELFSTHNIDDSQLKTSVHTEFEMQEV